MVRLRLDGTLLEGELPPIQGAVVASTPPRTRTTPRSGAGSKRWRRSVCSAVAYGPRGSDQAVANILATVTPGVPAVLLANHGVLVFHRTRELAALVDGPVEEAA